MSPGGEPEPASDPESRPLTVRDFKELQSSKVSLGLDAKGASASLEGPGGASRLLRLLLPPILSVLGMPAAMVVLLADKSLWLVLAAFVVPQVMALFWWKVLSKEEDVRPSPSPDEAPRGQGRAGPKRRQLRRQR